METGANTFRAGTGAVSRVLRSVAILAWMAVLPGMVTPAGTRASAWVPPPDIQEKPALARDGAGLLVVWSDQRDGILPRVYWTRLTAGLPDTVGVRLTSATAAAERIPRVAADGEWALAVWESRETLGAGIRAAELASEVQGPLPDAAMGGPGLSATRPSVAIRGDRALVLWEDDAGSGPGLFGGIWRRGTGPLATAGMPLFSDGTPRHHAQVAGGDEGFAALWTEVPPGGGPRVMAGILDTAGVLSASPVPLSDPGVDAYASDLLRHGDGFLAAWYQRESGLLSIGVRELDAMGLPVSGAVVHASASGSHRYDPRLTGVDGSTVIGWVEQSPFGRGLRRGLLDAGLSLDAVEGSWVAPENSYAADPALGALGGSLVVAWRQPLPGDDDDLHGVSLAPHDPAGPGTEGPLVLVPGESTGISPAVAPPLRLGGTPNPFRERVVIQGVPGLAPGEILDVHDVRGRRVASLRVNGQGWASWDGITQEGLPAPAGVYLVRGRRFAGAGRLLRLP